ncbi:dnaJ homolog subfamily B member 13-like [Tripterygium wilfordii]|uniref:dnaJ homolog subfamily B member 13-like n=1 Tax=Tripterygium wilfordii TaxID=458696 RepID=UPI0018F80A34|nr:dnaJ homolog subfamily B member 13-like [Tripterygium wilfordii]
MVDHRHILDIPTGGTFNISEQRNGKNIPTIGGLFKLYVSLFTGWCHDKKRPSPTKANTQHNIEAIDISDEDLDTQQEDNMNGVHSFRYNNPDGSKHKSMDNCFPSIPSPLSRCGSRRSPTPTPSSFRSLSRRSTNSNGFPPSLSRNASRRSTTPIMFSNSTGRMLKPPPIERKLECTLEELCFGCMKKIKITRDVLTNTGEVIQEEELLTIKVKPGWKKGTKITFEGMGNERPGSLPADVIFIIGEKRHHLFRREGDDLEVVVRIPLIKALAGCDISIPLLGGEKMSLKIDDIIHPGYLKIIEGEGMPCPKEQRKRGDLKVVFLVDFPTTLTDQQRSDVVSILQDSVE